MCLGQGVIITYHKQPILMAVTDQQVLLVYCCSEQPCFSHPLVAQFVVSQELNRQL
jgi:hypothetical protein